MRTWVQCPYCQGYNTDKTKNGNFSSRLATVGAVVGGALLEAASGIPGILSANLGFGRTWHQYCCHDCHEVFKVRLGAAGEVKEIKKY